MFGKAREQPLDSPMTRYAGPGVRPLTRVLIGPPGLPLISVTGLACVLLLYGASVPGGYFMTSIFGGLLAVGIAVVWAPRLLVGLVRADGRPGLRRYWARWAAIPLLGTVTAVLLTFDTSYAVRFALSEKSMEAIARELVAGGKTSADPGWAGLFQVSSVERQGGAVTFQLQDTGFLARYGLTWSPDGRPGVDSDAGYRHLTGPWYEWMERF
ncbi:hypothetical protein ACFYY8_07545 [Streptosporangium sp. NPDC001559]|uniref:hypothetical protein n=1 Tax=Streptosporangium sp. NPDC001559 TaxID=3366187 RepID=UPI0036EE2D32